MIRTVDLGGEPVILHEAMKVRARNVFSRAVVVDFAAYTAQDFSRVAVSVARLYPGLTVPISVKESAPRQLQVGIGTASWTYLFHC
jgi:hypothetical protein